MPERLEPGDPEKVGEYWLEGRLGAGGQGIVYAACADDGSRVAIKVLHPSHGASEQLAQMAREARAAQRVPSFCTAKILKVHLEGSRPHIVSEFIDGYNLSEIVRGRPEATRPNYTVGRIFAEDDLYRLMIGVATALTAIHEAKVVHRDLKPGNIIIGTDGPRLIDFGIARLVDTESHANNYFVGTLPYMAPEIYLGQRASAAADIFSWGAIAYFAATGKNAFSGGNRFEIENQIANFHPDLTVLPNPLRTLVLAALAKDPLARPSARYILSELTGDPSSDGHELMAAGSTYASLISRWEPVDPALSTVAEDAYNSLSPEEQPLVPEVFLRMVNVGDDGEISLRALPATELYDRERNSTVKAIQEIVTAFSAILSDSNGKITISRPAVLRAWPPLRSWLDQDRPSLRVHNKIRQAAIEWRDLGHRRTDVLAGRRLEEALLWAASEHRLISMNKQESDLIAASTRAQTLGIRRRRAITVVLSVVLIIALVATFIAVRAQKSADRQRTLADRQRDAVISNQLAAQSKSAADNPSLAALLAATAWRIQPSALSRDSLINAATRPARAVLDSQSSVESAQFSPDGKILATGQDDGTIRLWDVATHRQIGTPLAADDFVNSLAFSPDGATLATAGGNGLVRLWDVRAHREIGVPFINHAADATAVVFSPDGHMLATGSFDKTIRLWDLRRHQQLGDPLIVPNGPVYAIAFSPDGKTLASGSGDHRARLWDVGTHKQRGPDLIHTSIVTTVTFSPDGKTVATGSWDTTVRLWDTHSYRKIGTPFTGSPARISSVVFSRDGQTLVTGGWDGKTRLWDVKNHQQLGPSLGGHTSKITSVNFNPDGKGIATSSEDGTTRLWDVTAYRAPGTPLIGHTDAISSVACSPDGRLLATGSWDGTVRLWDAVSRKRFGAPLIGSNRQINEVSFSPDNKSLATVSDDGIVRIWDVITQRILSVLSTVEHAIYAVSFSPDGLLLVTAGIDHIRVWDVKARKQIGTPFAGEPDWVYSVIFSPDGKMIASGSAGNIIRIWDAQTHSQIGSPLKGNRGEISSIAFSPNGQTLASGSWDYTVRLWNLKTHQQLGTPLTGAADTVSSVVFSPDGQVLAAGSWDGSIRLWDVNSRQEIGTPFTGHVGRVNSISFTPNQAYLISGGSDGIARLWQTAVPQNLLGVICSIAGRNITRAEWAQYVPPGPSYRNVC